MGKVPRGVQGDLVGNFTLIRMHNACVNEGEFDMLCVMINAIYLISYISDVLHN